MQTKKNMFPRLIGTKSINTYADFTAENSPAAGFAGFADLKTLTFAANVSHN